MLTLARSASKKTNPFNQAAVVAAKKAITDFDKSAMGKKRSALVKNNNGNKVSMTEEVLELKQLCDK